MAPTIESPEKSAAPLKTDDPQFFKIITFGCQMNEYDSDIMRGVLETHGLTETEDEERADVILVNTCAVRDGAEERAFQRLANLRTLKKRRSTVLGMTGCVAQEHGAKVLDRLPFLDLIIGTRDLLKVGNLVKEARRTGERFVCVEDIDSPLPLPVTTVRRTRPLKAHVTIMLGCDKECTYCIVPKTRGAEWSRPVAEILEEIRNLILHGYREVMLLGQNVNSYRDRNATSKFIAEDSLEGIVDFPTLLREVDALGAQVEDETGGEFGLDRIRYTTSHPIDAGDDLWRAMAECPRVCRQIHLPVQAGADRILRRMKRLYRRDYYLERVAALRKFVPDVVLTTDLIVGFCGETEEEFQETLSLVREVQFDQAFMFMYSPRAGTPSAEKLPDDVPESEKKDRLARLIEIQEAIAGEKNTARVGGTFDVLVEGPAKYPENWLMGRTDGDIIVNFPVPVASGDMDAAAKDLIGKVIAVTITESSSHTLRGELSETATPLG